MVDNSNGVSMTRRTVLASTPLLMGATAGCSSILEDDESAAAEAKTTKTAQGSNTETPEDDPVLLADGFEDGYGSTFVDRSFSNATPSLTQERAYEGSQALDLQSSPGNQTLCAISTAETFEDPMQYSAMMNRYVALGDRNATGIRLSHTESDATLKIFISGYYGGVAIKEFDRNYDGIQSKQVAMVEPEDEWTNLQLQVEDDSTVRGVVNGESMTMETDANWTELPLRMVLAANAWGSGQRVAAAVDAVEVSNIEA